MPNADTDFRNMIAAAREFCAMIERVDAPDGACWLRGMAQLLPKLHSALVSLSGELPDIGTMPSPDLEIRFELYSHLKTVLGERDEYWLEFDVAQDGQSKSGSLADDLTDIYWELKQGLELLEARPSQSGQVLGNWEHGYRLDWGQHVVDAERHLYVLRSRDQLGP